MVDADLLLLRRAVKGSQTQTETQSGNEWKIKEIEDSRGFLFAVLAVFISILCTGPEEIGCIPYAFHLLSLYASLCVHLFLCATLLSGHDGKTSQTMKNNHLRSPY